MALAKARIKDVPGCPSRESLFCACVGLKVVSVAMAEPPDAVDYRLRQRVDIRVGELAGHDHDRHGK